MILHLSSAAARVVWLACAFVLAVLLSFFSLRNALAVHDRGLGTRAGYEGAIRLEPRDAMNWYLLGRYQQYSVDDADATRAIDAYRESIELNPHSVDTWLDLAAADESENKMDAADEAFRQAQKAYPLSAQADWRYGNFLLRQGEISRAFPEIRKAVYLDPKRGGEAFSRCWRVDPDIDRILNEVLPQDRDAYLAVLKEFTANDDADHALTVWSRMAAFRPSLQLQEIFDFTDMLIRARRLADAWRVWNEGSQLAGISAVGALPGSVLWDGGFETGARGGGFAWSYGPRYSPVEATFDTREKHSGRQSMHLAFNGKQDVDFEDVCATGRIQAGTAYRLSGWIRTQALTSDEGVRLRMGWTGKSGPGSLETPDVRGTQPWTKVEAPLWVAGEGVDFVRVCIVRLPSTSLNNRIRGSAWIDDVALVPAPPGPPGL